MVKHPTSEGREHSSNKPKDVEESEIDEDTNENIKKSLFLKEK
jgi:hypothetical protein